MIAKQKDELVADRQKLIYQGKIMEDDKDVGSYGIAENGFVVCMMQKPSATAAAAPPAEAAPPPVGAAQEPEPAPQAAAPAPSGPSPQEQAAQQMVAQVVEMTGFPEDQVRGALAAAQGDANVAVELLMTGGVPDGMYGDEDVGGEMEEGEPEPAGGQGDMMSMNLIPPELLAQTQGQQATPGTTPRLCGRSQT